LEVKRPKSFFDNNVTDVSQRHRDSEAALLTLVHGYKRSMRLMVREEDGAKGEREERSFAEEQAEEIRELLRMMLLPPRATARR
jgi:hypothetical protein